MTRFSARSIAPRIHGALLACTLAAATLLGPFALSAAQAATGGTYYRATLAAPLTEPRKEILNGVVWSCAGDSCTGTKSGSRPVIVCGRLAHHVGEVASFTAAETTLEADALAACNKR